jgi:hypothetical protein
VYGDEENGILSTLVILIGIKQKRVRKNMGISTFGKRYVCG